MSPLLKPDESPLRGARQLLIEQVDSALHTLQQHSLADEPVHETRKQMKRIRAGLRLLRAALGEAAYQHLNRLVRNAARPLTSIRDTKILCDALDNVGRQAGTSAQNGAAQLRQALQQEHRSSRDQLSEKNLDSIRTRLHQVKQRLQSVPASRLDHAATDAALKRAYKKAYKAFAVAEQEPSNEHLHEWRKQVKYHFYQLEFIQPLKPKRLGATIKQAHRLSDYLGDDQDLALLHEKIVLHATQAHGASDTAAGALIKTLKHQRAKLQRKSHQLGKKLYADKPKQIAKRLGKFVNGKSAEHAMTHGGSTP